MYEPCINPRQQTSPAKTLESPIIDVFCVSKTCIRDPSVTIHLTSPKQYQESIRYTLRLFGDSTTTFGRLAFLGIALIMKAEQILLK